MSDAILWLQGDTLAGVLQQNMHSGQAFTVSMRLSKRVPLQGDELKAWVESQTAHVVDEEKTPNRHAPSELPSRCGISCSATVSVLANTFTGVLYLCADAMLSSSIMRQSRAGGDPAQDEHREHREIFAERLWRSKTDSCLTAELIHGGPPCSHCAHRWLRGARGACMLTIMLHNEFKCLVVP